MSSPVVCASYSASVPTGPAGMFNRLFEAIVQNWCVPAATVSVVYVCPLKVPVTAVCAANVPLRHPRIFTRPLTQTSTRV